MSEVSETSNPIAHVILIDDEKDILELVEENLLDLNYKVTSFFNPTDAVKFIKKHIATIDIIITDQSMPNLKGTDLCKEVLKQSTTIPFIIASGDISLKGSNEYNDAQIKDVLRKPYMISELDELITYHLKKLNA
ncbi:MAG: two-component system cell cycle sensor histidine kinase/response regulator CckA [Thermoproteota archaeon]|jgi:two-component system cell cycle sensor histidine kinase/response regulator CckA